VLIKQWSIPPQQSGEFVYRMEDVLEAYPRPYDPKYPQVCMEEKGLQLLASIRDPLPPQPGQVTKQDYEYQRQGSANAFMYFDPLAGRRYVKVTTQHTTHQARMGGMHQ
jgi:hypothetical protein